MPRAIERDAHTLPHLVTLLTNLKLTLNFTLALSQVCVCNVRFTCECKIVNGCAALTERSPFGVFTLGEAITAL